MPHDTLRDLFLEQVQDMHSACTQSHEMTRALANAATNTDLKEALLDGVRGIERGRDTIEQIAAKENVNAERERCRGMEGLVEEANSDVFGKEFTDDDTRDAAIIAQYQRMAHYAIAGYGTLCAFARRLDLDDTHEALEHCLKKSYDGDHRMTEIARGEVNPQAA